jgi:beta-phosphoglucomutase
MSFIQDYQLFLFDFDGLLVNSEELHFKAYQKVCASYGFVLDWTIDRYFQAAHYHSEGLYQALNAQFPQLKEKGPAWDVLYAKKQQAVLELAEKEGVHMMPGAAELLQILNEKNIKRCVVTHSPDWMIKLFRRQNPILDTIPEWITRENYTHPKPHPECYEIAIKRLANKKDAIIGFEDTPRGLQALMKCPLQSILICQAGYPEISSFLQQGVLHYPSLERWLQEYKAG